MDSEDDAVAARRAFLAGRGRVPRVPKTTISLTRPIAWICSAAVLLSAVTLLLADPRSNNSVLLIIGIGGLPMLATALVIELLRQTHRPRQSVRPQLLWWLLGVMPAGIIVLAAVMLLRDPAAFGVSSPGEFVTTLFTLAGGIFVGILAGGLCWFFVVFPVGAIAQAVGEFRRDGRFSFSRILIPVLMLMLTTVILVSIASIDVLNPNPRNWWPGIAALLGVPAGYRVTSEVGLWIARGIVALGAILVLWQRAVHHRGSGQRP